MKIFLNILLISNNLIQSINNDDSNTFSIAANYGGRPVQFDNNPQVIMRQPKITSKTHRFNRYGELTDTPSKQNWFSKNILRRKNDPTAHLTKQEKDDLFKELDGIELETKEKELEAYEMNLENLKKPLDQRQKLFKFDKQTHINSHQDRIKSSYGVFDHVKNKHHSNRGKTFYSDRIPTPIKNWLPKKP